MRANIFQTLDKMQSVRKNDRRFSEEVKKKPGEEYTKAGLNRCGKKREHHK